MVYSELEPFGELRADMRAGVIAAVLANANRDPKKRKNPYEPSDFFSSLLPVEAGGDPKKAEQIRREQKRQTPAQMLAIAEMLNAALGGKDLRFGSKDDGGVTPATEEVAG